MEGLDDQKPFECTKHALKGKCKCVGSTLPRNTADLLTICAFDGRTPELRPPAASSLTNTLDSPRLLLPLRWRCLCVRGLLIRLSISRRRAPTTRTTSLAFFQASVESGGVLDFFICSFPGEAILHVGIAIVIIIPQLPLHARARQKATNALSDERQRRGHDRDRVALDTYPCLT